MSIEILLTRRIVVVGKKRKSAFSECFDPGCEEESCEISVPFYELHA